MNFDFEFAQMVLTMNQLFELLDIIWRVAVQHVFAVFREVEQSRIYLKVILSKSIFAGDGYNA